MAFLKRLASLGSVIIVALFAPAILLKLFRVPLPSVARLLATIAMRIIPLEIAIIGTAFCAGVIMLFQRGRRARSLGQMLTAALIFPVGCLLTIYVLLLSVKTMWLWR